jgi:hypothetical protein
MVHGLHLLFFVLFSHVVSKENTMWSDSESANLSKWRKPKRNKLGGQQE